MHPHTPQLQRARFQPIVAVSTIVTVILSTLLLFVPQAIAASTESTIWGNAAPKNLSLDDDKDAVTLGTRFTPTTDGSATGVRFYKTEGMSGVHTGFLWDADGSRLGSVTFSNETESGWQTARFGEKISLDSGTTYIVGYQVPAGGGYAATPDYLSQSSSEALSVSKRGAGMYTYSTRATLPRSVWQSSQYWVDITFTASTSPVEIPAPTATPTPPRPTPTPTLTPRPTPTPTATPKPSPAPSVPPTIPPVTVPPATDGFPTASSAGFPKGSQPTQTVSGDYWVRTAGAVVQDLRVTNGRIYIAAPNVTLRRVDAVNVSLVNYVNGTCYNGLTIEDSSFVKQSASDDSGDPAIGPGGYTLRNVLVDGYPEGPRVGGKSLGCGPVSIEDAFISITSPQVCTDWHGDGIQGYDGAALVLRNSTVVMSEKNGCYGTAPFFYPDGQGNTSVDIDGLLVQGGGYPFRNGMPGRVINLNIVENSWGYGPFSVKCSVISAWQANVVRLGADGQPQVVRPVGCTTETEG